MGKGALRASAAPAIATGGSPTKRCFSTRPDATPRRIRMRRPTARPGASFSRCCASTASRRPVNGVILTISAQDLLLQGDSGREAQVEAARRRLIELNQELHIQLPVYLMVTKCDLVAGFTEYFDELTQEGRAQVWGVTFPYEQTVNGEAARAFPAEFDALMGRLNARVFDALEEERDSRRRTRVFAFPQQMAGLRDVLGQFVSEVFASTRFDQPILLRGVYFTSGTQDGTPIDRLLGAIGRRFGVASEAVAASTGRGKAYFVERLLKEVLIGESGLAGVNRRVEMRKAALQLGAYAAMALLAVLGVIALSVSYRRNQAFIAEVATDLARVRAVPAVAPEAPLEALLAAPGRHPRRRRFGRSISNRYPLGDAVGPLSGRLRRQFRARRLSAGARRDPAAAVRGAREGTSGGVRLGAGKAVRLSEGVSDAGRSQASRQDAPPVSGRSRMESDGRSRPCDRSVALEALREPARRTGRHCGQSAWIQRSSRRRAAPSGGLDPADHVRPAEAEPRCGRPHAVCASTSQRAWASSRCSDAGAGSAFRSRCRLCTHEPSSRKPPARA